MEFRKLGGSDLRVPVLSFGTATFGDGEGFKFWGANGVKEATRVVDLCLEAGVTMFDSADIYSAGQAEEILGQAIKGRRDRVILSTKGTFRFSDAPDDAGSSRRHLTRSIEGSLKRLGTDCIDLYQLHGFDALTPVEEAVGWSLTPGQVAQLDAASAKPRIYPYWRQAQFAERNPFPTA